MASTGYADNLYWVYGIVLGDKMPAAQIIMEKLAEKGVGTRPFFYPLHSQPVIKQLGFSDSASFPVANSISKNGFYLPSGLALDSETIHRVAEVVIEVLSS